MVNSHQTSDILTNYERISILSRIAKATIANEYAIMYEMQSDPQAAIEHYQTAAIVTLDSAKLDKYKDSIERCRKKIELLTSQNN